MHRMTSDWSWTLKNKKYPIYTTYLPPRPKFQPFLLCDQPFSRYKIDETRKFRKCTDWPQTEFEILTVKSTSSTLSTYPWGPNFGSFCSTTAGFRDLRLLKIGNARNGLKWLEHLTVESTMHTLSPYPEAQILVRFVLRPAVFQIHSKVVKNRKSRKWPPTDWALDGKKYIA